MSAGKAAAKAPKDAPKSAAGNTYDVIARAQAVTLKQYTALSNAEIEAITGISSRQIVRYNAKATQRGYVKGQRLEKHHLVDDKRTGRPGKAADGVAPEAASSHHLETIAAAMDGINIGKDPVRGIQRSAGAERRSNGLLS